jgi:hypothetical protein
MVQPPLNCGALTGGRGRAARSRHRTGGIEQMLAGRGASSLPAVRRMRSGVIGAADDLNGGAALIGVRASLSGPDSLTVGADRRRHIGGIA